MMGRQERESGPEVPGPARLECAAYWQEIIMEILPQGKKRKPLNMRYAHIQTHIMSTGEWVDESH